MARRRASACLACGPGTALPGLTLCLACHTAEQRAAAHASGRSLGRAEMEIEVLYRLMKEGRLRPEYSDTHVAGPPNVVPFCPRAVRKIN